MAKFAIQYRKEPGEHGTWILIETGWCLAADANAIESGCTKRYKMVALPHSSGAVMKVLDGTRASIVSVTPTTYSLTYRCVKVLGQVTPLAPRDAANAYSGSAVLQYEIRYQEVGGIR